MHHRGRTGRKSSTEEKRDRKKILLRLKRPEETEGGVAQRDAFNVKKGVEGYKWKLC